MTLKRVRETPEERKLHSATDRALHRFHLLQEPAWNKLQKALRTAWRQYDKDIAPFEKTCDRKITRASQAYTKATQNKGDQK